MVETVRSFLRDNSALAVFLGAQLLAAGAASATMLAYMVRLEIRVSTMEERGAPAVAIRLGKIDERLTVLEGTAHANTQRLERIVEIMTREMRRVPP